MTNTLLILFLVTFATFSATLFLTWLLRRKLIKDAVLDRPNERSSHKEPVPRGGGLAVIFVILVGLVMTLAPDGAFSPYVWLLLGTVLLILVSWLDDLHGVGSAIRLSVHILAAAAGSLAFAPNQMLFEELLPLWADRAVLIILWAWFMNLYNFMDGIDGITGIETTCLVIGAALLFAFSEAGGSFHYALIALLMGASGGFLVLNWHPAQIFLGDVGSIPLGYLTGFLLLTLALNNLPVPALILPLYYLADSGITLGRRILRREKFWQAHRQHFYQRATLKAGRHDVVVYWILYANLGLIIAALLAFLTPSIASLLAFVIVALLLRKMHKVASQ